MPRISSNPCDPHPDCLSEQAATRCAIGEPPVGAPADFWKRVAAALKTAEPEVLRAAAAAYRGVYESEHAYVVGQVAERLQPPNLAWLLACCEPARLREAYERGALVVWSIGLEDGGWMVFESVREPLTVVRTRLSESTG